MTLLPLLSLALRGLCPLHANGTLWAVFRPIGFRQIVAAAEDAFFQISPMEQGGAQASVQRQDGGAKPAAHQRICDTLNTDTFLTIIQEQTVPAIVIAAAIAPHLIAVLNGDSLSRFLEKFQKLFADSFNA